MSTSNQFSLLKGFSFKFYDGDKVIESWFSSYTGLEQVRVDGETVARQRNFSSNSSNLFEIDGVPYRTCLEVKNLFKGPFVCALFKNEKPFKQQRLVFPALEGGVPWYRRIWFYIFVGLVLGFLASYFNFSFWVVVGLITVLSVFNYLNTSHFKPTIEEVNSEGT